MGGVRKHSYHERGGDVIFPCDVLKGARHFLAVLEDYVRCNRTHMPPQAKNVSVEQRQFELNHLT